MTTDFLPLAAEFPATTETQWRKLVDAALKGADFDKRLVSKTYDGLRIDPLYPRAMDARPVAGRAAGAPWTVMQRVDHPDPTLANAQALHDLENGATGLSLVFAGATNANGFGLDGDVANIARALDGIFLDAGIGIELNLSTQTRMLARELPALTTRLGVAPNAVELRVGLNPIGGFATAGASPASWGKIAPGLAALIAELSAAGFRGPFAVGDGRIVHNAGGSEAQELAFALACALSYLRALDAHGVPLDTARGMIYFRLTADADEFVTIAKFRALRKLWARIEQACGLAPKLAFVAAETASRMLTRRDADVNMLRNTIAVAAAALGGADSISVLPHTFAVGLPDDLARRIARNTQLILLEESNLARVADPAAGAGGLEDLTAKLCAMAWALFQDIERDGGIWASLEAGSFQQKVAAVRAEREKSVARRRDPLTGASEYPNIHEQAPRVLDVTPRAVNEPPAAVRAPAGLPSMRVAEPFEALRDASDAALAKSGTRPKVFLVTLGKVSEFTARAMFAKNFYEAGGIEAVTNDSFANREEMIAAFRASGAKLACLCSSDEVYAREASDAAAALSAAGALVHLAGRPGDNEAELRRPGINTFIYAGCDAVSTLRAAHDSLSLS